MTLLAYALTTLDSLKTYLRMTDVDFRKPVINIYNGSSDATASTIQITDTQMILIVTGGVNDGTETLTFADADSDTMAELVVKINALAKGWVASVVSNGSQDSGDLEVLGATGCLLVANQISAFAPDNELLEQLINSITELIERITGRRFIATDYTDEEYDGPGGFDLFLNQFPIISVTNIKRTYRFGDSDTLDSDYYDIYKDAGYIYYVSGFVGGRVKYSITYRAGYETIPDDLEALCNEMVALNYKYPDKEGISSERTMNYSVAYNAAALPESITKKLGLWKKISI